VAPENWIVQLPEGVQSFVRQLQTLPDFPYQLAQFALVLRHRDRNPLPAELARRAWALAPHEARVRLATAWAMRRSVPLWHFPMVHDQGRNAVYAQALQQYVTPDMCVLEIGTGAGLVAMLAARAGARHVYTCEMEPPVAEAARENIVRNGLADRITVINKPSTELVVGVDLPARADLLVSELLDNSILGEAVLPTLEDAKARLIQPSAPILPYGIALRGVLVDGAPWRHLYRMDESCGLDLSAFNHLAPPTILLPIAGQTLDDALSDEVELLRFDFHAEAHFPKAQRDLTLQACRDGVAHGLLHWLWLGFSDTLQYDNRPPRQSVWSPILHVFPHPIPLQAGQCVTLSVAHDRHAVMIWPT
jgi:type II protein arginine methyltransferase